MFGITCDDGAGATTTHGRRAAQEARSQEEERLQPPEEADTIPGVQPDSADEDGAHDAMRDKTNMCRTAASTRTDAGFADVDDT